MDQTQETLAALQRLTEEHRLKLLQHAIWESRAFYWRTGSGKMRHSAGERAALAEGNSPEDVVQEAVALTLDGTRTWDRAVHPELFDFLKLVITSLTRNLASSGDNRMVRAMPENEDGKVREDLLPIENLLPSVDGQTDGQPDDEVPGPEAKELEAGEAEPPEARLLRLAEGQAAIELDDKIVSAILDDDQLIQLYEHRQAGKKLEEIMKLMSLTPKDAYRLMKKLRRRVDAVLNGEAK